MPTPPIVLMEPPQRPVPASEFLDLSTPIDIRDYTRLLIHNNSIGAKNRIQLEELQEWVRTNQKIYQGTKNVITK